MNKLAKKELRARLKKARNELPQAQVLEHSKIICQSILSSPYYQKAKSLALYHAFGNEVDLSMLYEEALLKGKGVCLPIVNMQKNLLHFVEVDKSTPLFKNQLGMLEPNLSDCVQRPLQSLDLLIMPLLGFDEHCNRLGMGGGFYDRTLVDFSPQQRPRLVGVAHQCQYSPELNLDPWDVSLDCIITEKKVYDRV